MTVLYGPESATPDPCTDTILDFIAGGWKDAAGKKHAMESGGNYNAVIGEPNAKNDLSRYRLDSIYVLQNSLIERGRTSTAVGRYQFLKRTLQGLAERAGMEAFTRFSPEVQDNLAWQLLCQQGYARWWRGKLDNEDFAHNLAGVWASLPDPFNDGKSRYDKLAGNHAGCTLNQFEAMLTLAYSRRGG